MLLNEKTPNILRTVDDDIRIENGIPAEEFPHSIPHQEISEHEARRLEEQYDRTFRDYRQ